MELFAVAVFFLIVTPGPGVLSAAGVGASYGRGPGLQYVGGLFVGNLAVMLAVISGLAGIILALPALRIGLMVISTAYLLYLASRIAFSGNRLGFIHPRTPPGFWSGFALQPINPKAYAVNTAFFSGFAFAGQSFWVETILKLLIVNAIWVPIHLVWLWAGIRVQEMNLPDHIQSTINLIMAASMLLVVGLALYAQFGRP